VRTQDNSDGGVGTDTTAQINADSPADDEPAVSATPTLVNENGDAVTGAERVLGDIIIEPSETGDQPPKIGMSRQYDHPDGFEIICIAPSREGNPPTYQLHGLNHGMMKNGNWETVLNAVKAIIGDEGIILFNDSIAPDNELAPVPASDELAGEPASQVTIIRGRGRQQR
jgi:hypothetical protein